MQQNHIPTQPSIKKAIVIGGGIGGLTLARAFLDVGIDVELYEKRSLDAMLSGPGGIFIQRNAIRIYQLLCAGKLYNALYEKGGKIGKGGFFNQKGRPLYINAPEFIQEENLGICLLRPELQQILYQALPPDKVHTEVAFEKFEDLGDRVRVSFQDGSSTEGDILVGADGLYSRVRASLENCERLTPPVYSGTTCWRGYFSGVGLPLDPEYSWLEFWGKGNRFGYFDVGDGRFSFYAFQNTAMGGEDASQGGALLMLRSLASNYAEPVPTIVNSLGEYPIYRDDIFDREPLGQQWGKGRVTLIGDAAHPVQPSLGQGGCMAIEDAFELAKQLKQAGDRTQIVSLLREFEASRSHRVAQVFTSSRQVSQLGQTESAVGCFMRNWIYQLTPTWLGDLQFKWLFDYHPTWG
ncbi:FAD-dependent monooxygenase [Trichocoleus sp. FACHB-591]|uniref:FAD-dependent monooxygenase n=1 Tax=Trichocoleus sp. FACHB-591 TaxID=2692872 RepID=UPI001683B107|nr:FAD-dependent monooxygenase [Trichocoleus sp. FACHB-591]MBD2094951.1 FAD-dependent monooxygenase [Trichocoleus sp. FACHB-591]